MANFIDVTSQETLDGAFELSRRQPVVLFKHSTTCGISAAVFREVSRLADDIFVVTMQTHRALATDIAQRTGIRHESPQAIVLLDAEAFDHASHYDIEADKLRAVLDKAAAKNATPGVFE